jgi:hypothetical protein
MSLNDIRTYTTLLYWQNETSGKLEQSILKYFDGQDLQEFDIINLATYIRIWANFEYFDQTDGLQNLKKLAKAIATREDIKNWIDLALHEGIDPF